jgi:hypothetical protein
MRVLAIETETCRVYITMVSSKLDIEEKSMV